MKSFHVAIAAEAFAAGMLAHAGYDVLVQYGANQPQYDLVASQGTKAIHISVKGSQGGGWGLFQSHKNEKRNYHQSVEAWAAGQEKGLIYCLVQFKDVALGSCPRAYIASVKEIVAHMKNVRAGHGDTILWEHHTYKAGVAKGFTDAIPTSWRLTHERIDKLFKHA